MGLFDKLIRAVGDATEKAVDAAFAKTNAQKPAETTATAPTQQTVTETVQQAAAPDAERIYKEDGHYEFNRSFNRDTAYFRGILQRNFPMWQITENVSISTLTPSAHPKCMPVTFMLQNGTQKFAFFVMRDGQQSGMPYKGTLSTLKELRIKSTHCISCYKNEESYVVNRINQAM